MIQTVIPLKLDIRQSVEGLEHDHTDIPAIAVVASCMIAKWKWSKLQEYLSLHRLLGMFPNMIAAENKG